MRIDTPTVAPVSNEAKSGQPATTPQQPSSTATQSPAAVVTLSSAAAKSTTTGEIREMPDPKVIARIAQIRQQLQNGSYPIDLDVLATRIADDEVARGAS
jgi:flagellar biosynthesis anti-sigma factor FlgM